MVLSIVHPDVMRHIRSFAVGLLPLRKLDSGELLLVIKVQKEAILAAKLKGGFAFYLAPIMSSSGLTVSLITAFFDDEDEPLTIISPLFSDDSHTSELLEILTYQEIDVYFFDEHNREWLSYRSSIIDGGSCLTDGTDFGLLTYHPRTTESILENLPIWFGNRKPEDDYRAIRVNFQHALGPEDFFITDLTEAGNDYLGSVGFRRDMLIRDDPGYFQERDIAAGFRRAFAREQIVLNPRRQDNGRSQI
jgi:hypothetical protein